MLWLLTLLFFVFFFNDTATTEIYTLSLHDALPISATEREWLSWTKVRSMPPSRRSEEHTSELQSRVDLVCRLLLEKKKKKHIKTANTPKKKANTKQTNKTNMN